MVSKAAARGDEFIVARERTHLNERSRLSKT
jgi:hypothetical protein